MNLFQIIALILAVGLAGVFVWQLIKLILDIKKYRKSKKQSTTDDVNNKESN